MDQRHLQILFDLKGASKGEILLTRSFEIDIGFVGLKVPNVGFLVVIDPNTLIKSEKKAKRYGIIR